MACREKIARFGEQEWSSGTGLEGMSIKKWESINI